MADFQHSALSTQYSPCIVACSTGSLARYPGGNDPVTLAGYLRRLEADAAEVLFYGRWRDDLPRAASAFRDCGLPIAVVHSEKNLGGAFGSADPAVVADGQRRFLDAAWLAEQVGARKLVLHLWDKPDSDRFLERNLAALAALLPRARDAGLTVCLETIPCDVSNPVDNVLRCLEYFGGADAPSSADDGGPSSGATVVRQGAGLAVTLDLEFLGWHGCVERGVSGVFAPARGALAGVADVHVRDYDGRPFTPEGRRRYIDPGEGLLDFPAIFGALVRDGFSGPYTYEGSTDHPPADGDVAAVNTVLHRMRAWLAEAVAAAAVAV